MSREIKFRAWDEIEEKYNNDTDIVMTLNGDYCVDKGRVRLFPKLTLEQYTGLKDKNGKEIYEGDIVRVAGEVASSMGSIADGIAEVVWVPSAAGFGEKFSCMGKPMVPFGSYPYEIIGNIHENPELLEG